MTNEHLKSTLKRHWWRALIFAIFCFIVADSAAIHNLSCGSSPCRSGDEFIVGDFYYSSDSFGPLAPLSYFESGFWNAIGGYRLTHEVLSPIGGSLMVDPMHPREEVENVRSAINSRSDREYYRGLALEWFLLHKLYVLFNLPWWIFLYAMANFTYAKIKRRPWKIALLIAYGLVLAVLSFIGFLLSLHFGGEVDVTWDVIFNTNPDRVYWEAG